jgi:4'-phosphopantetheinyl transferase
LPAPSPGIALWLCKLDRLPTDVASLFETLSPLERARAQRFGTELLRHRWIAGRAMLRSLLGLAAGLDAASVRLRRGVRGRPEIEGDHAIDFNISHTHDTAIIAIATKTRENVRIGVDIEREDRRVNADGLARKFLTARERAEIAPEGTDAYRRQFIQLWTCKEAMSKATGDALSAPFREMDVTLDGGRRLVSGPLRYAPADWRLIAADVPAGLIATLAVWNRP